MAEIRRIVRNQDADVSDAIEKFNRLSARMAKRVHRGDTEVAPPPENGAYNSNAAAVDPISARILARRARKSLAEEALDGVLPKG